MKQIFIIILLFYSINSAQIYMNINNKDGTVKSFSIDQIRKLTFTNIVGIEQELILANALKLFTLLQNYPNPFNPSTTIEYKIPEPGIVKILIYDIRGQLVKTVENNFKKAGNYKLTWNSENEFGQKVSSGIYLLQAKFNSKMLLKKIMLIK